MAVLEPQKNAYYRLYSINRGGNPGELPLPLVGLHSPPPPRVSSQPLGGLLERPCVSLCAYRLQVFSSRYRIKGFFCTRLFQILNNPTQIRLCCSIFSLSLNASLFLIRSILDQLGMRYAVFRRDLHELEPQTLQISLLSALVSVIEAF